MSWIQTHCPQCTSSLPKQNNVPTQLDLASPLSYVSPFSELQLQRRGGKKQQVPQTFMAICSVNAHFSQTLWLLMSHHHCPNIATLSNPSPTLPLNSHATSAQPHQNWEGYILLLWATGVKPDSNGAVPASCSFTLPASFALLLQDCICLGDEIFEFIGFLEVIPLSPSIHPLERDTMWDLFFYFHLRRQL